MPRKATSTLAKSNAEAIQLKITLVGSQPAIWRRVLVSPRTTLELLHWIIQEVMPWTNSHMHAFRDRDDRSYADVDSGLEDAADEARFTVGQLLNQPRAKMIYEYDFGDGWEHLIQWEKAPPLKPDQPLPFCTAGERNAPPDDCGGIWGYADLLAALKDPDHSMHEEMREWAGEDFDPEAFDLDQINRALKKLKM